MLPRFELSEPEMLTLKELAQNHPFPDFRRRALGVLALARGRCFSQVANELDVTVQSVYNWARAWRTRGVAGLLGGHAGGAPAKLTATLLDEAERIAHSGSCTLAEVEQRLREVCPNLPEFCLECLGSRLRRRGFYFNQQRKLIADQKIG